MLKSIIEKLNTIAPCYSLETFNIDVALLNPIFLCVEIDEKETIGRSSFIPLSIYLFFPLDAQVIQTKTKNAIIKMLHKRKLKKKESEGFFWIEFERATSSHVEKTVKKRYIHLFFRIPAV